MLINPYIYKVDSLFPTPLTGVTHIIFMGASLEVGMIESSPSNVNGEADTKCTDYLASQGLPGITVMRYAATGATVDTVYQNWTNTYKAAIQSLVTGGGNVVVAMQPLGNTITDLRPFASAVEATKAAKYLIYQNLISEVKAVVGSRNVFLVHHTFRNYDPTTSCITDQSLGSKPFNDNWVIPQAMLTDWMYGGLPYVDLYPIDYNNYSHTFIDTIHSKPVHYPAKTKLVIDSIIAAIKGVAPPRVALKADPIADQKTKTNRAILQYRSVASVTRSANLLGATYRGTTTAAQDSIGPMDTYEPVFGLGARTKTWISNANTGYGTGDTTRTILNDNNRVYYQGYTGSVVAWELFETITNCDITKPLNIKIMACRGATAGLTRMMDISFDGGTTTAGSVDCACQATVVPNVVQYSIMPDSSGNVALWTRLGTGNTTGYGIAAIEIWQ